MRRSSSASSEGRQDLSWRSYAAGVPWLRDQESRRAVERLLRKLDTVGSPENKIAYIAAQPGAGGTTLARAIGFEAARAGYPTLVAKSIPFSPEGAPSSWLPRARPPSVLATAAALEQVSNPEDQRLYETPCVIVFDRLHFDRREGDLRHFLNELTRSGRPARLCSLSRGPSSRSISTAMPQHRRLRRRLPFPRSRRCRRTR